MTYGRPLLSLLPALLAACTVTKDLGPTGGDPETDTSASEATEGADPTEGEPPTDGPSCAAQTDRASCEALEFESGDTTPFCLWLDWTPVTLAGELCSFGEPKGKCVQDFAGSEGCGFDESCGKPNIAALWKKEGDQVSLAYATVCIDPPEGARCDPWYEGEEVAAECACTCMPGSQP